MDSEKQEPIISHYNINTPPKLSLPAKRPCLTADAPTPPPRTAALSVPFKWEEAPGKPRPCHTRSEPKEKDVRVARALGLPPRLLSLETTTSNKVCSNNEPSPTTVLEGPYVGRAVSFTTSYRGFDKDTESFNFGSSMWGGLKKNNKVDREGSFDFSSWTVDGTSKVKITRVRRRGSFSSLSQGSSHFWVGGSVVEPRDMKELQAREITVHQMEMSQKTMLMCAFHHPIHSSESGSDRPEGADDVIVL